MEYGRYVMSINIILCTCDVQVIRVTVLHSAVDASELARHSQHACTQVFSTSGPTPAHTHTSTACNQSTCNAHN